MTDEEVEELAKATKNVAMNLNNLCTYLHDMYEKYPGMKQVLNVIVAGYARDELMCNYTLVSKKHRDKMLEEIFSKEASNG